MDTRDWQFIGYVDKEHKHLVEQAARSTNTPVKMGSAAHRYALCTEALYTNCVPFWIELGKLIDACKPLTEFQIRDILLGLVELATAENSYYAVDLLVKTAITDPRQYIRWTKRLTQDGANYIISKDGNVDITNLYGSLVVRSHLPATAYPFETLANEMIAAHLRR